MSITFRCEHCHKEVKAPDEAGGKRGRCPHCGQTSYIPQPVDEDEVLDVAPIDETEEQQRRREIEELRKQERDLIAETGGEPAGEAEGADATSEQLYHHVVNYCLDLFTGKLDRAATHVRKLKPHGYIAVQAVEDFQTGKALEPALDPIPPKVLNGFLEQLRGELRG